MKITVVGTGYVGLVSGACLAEMGNDVLCLDLDPEKIRILKEGGIPIHEPGLDQVVARNVAAGRLHFTTDVQEAVQFGTIQFIAVGTPPDEDGSADLQYVLSAARAIGRHMTDYKVIVDKSTVPVGTGAKVHAAIAEELHKRGAAPEDTQLFSELITRCDEAQYSPVASARMSDVYRDGLELISRIESIIKR